MTAGIQKTIRLGMVAFLVVAAVAAGFLFGTYSSQVAHRQYAHERSQTYAAQAERRVAQSCPQRQLQPFVQCVVEVVTTTRESQRAEHDLTAQQEMADWARNAVFLSGVAIFISGFGLFALLKTIDQGRTALERAEEANKIAQQASELDFRPIMAFVSLTMRPGPPGIFYVRPHWTNIGKLPASPLEAIVRRSYIEGVPEEADVQTLKVENGNKIDNFIQIVPAGQPLQGPDMAMRLDQLNIIDQFPHGVPQLDGAPPFHWRYRAQNTFLLIATLKYKVAVGDVEREWESEIVLPLTPVLDAEHQFLPPDRWLISENIKNRVRMN